MTDRPADDALFEAAFRDAAVGMALVAPDGQWLKVNDAFCQLLGYGREQLLALEFAALTPEDDRAADQQRNRELLEGQTASFQIEKRYIHSAGHAIWVQDNVSLSRDAEGKPVFFLIQVADVGARRRNEAEARAFFENSLDLLAIADIETPRLSRVNPAWRTALGYSDEELTSRSFLEFVHAEDHARTIEAVEELRAGKPVRSFRNRYLAKDGTLHWLDWTTQPDEGGRVFCVARDVTEQVQHEEVRTRLEEEIRQAALIDALTSIYNRRGFFLLAEQALRAAMRHQRSYVLCFFDLNGLKEINDELGHERGDDALLDMADILRHVFRSSDILARLGGDEFVALAEGDAGAEGSLRQRVGDEIARHNADAGRAYNLSVSMGVAMFDPRRPLSLAELLQRADRQMYEYKRSHRAPAIEQSA